ncbi:MAG: type VI secretion system protein TssA [Pirellulaceae bacterium]
MASPEVIDVEALASPISEESPSGVELRRSPQSDLFHNLRALFEKSTRAERDMLQAQAFPDEEFPDLEDPDWEGVQSASLEILSEHSKDLSVTSWLVESLIRTDGVVGLRDGMKLCLEICRRYWANIHPEPDEDDGYEDTVAQLAGLAAERSFPVLMAMPLTNGAGGMYSFADFNEANRISGLDSSERQKRLEEGAVDRGTFDNSFQATPAAHWQNMAEDLDLIIQNIRELGSFLDENCTANSYGEETSPSLTSFRQKIEAIQSTIKTLMSDLLDDADAAAEGDGTGEVSADGTAAPAGGGGGGMVVGTIQSRTEAVKALRKVADFFRKTEPHSPVSYALEQVANWAGLTLPELLKELINDSSVLDDLSRRAGIPKVESGDEY